MAIRDWIGRRRGGPTTAPAGSAVAIAAAGEGAGTGEPTVAGPAAPFDGGWPTVGPMPLTIARAALVTDPPAFERGVGTRRNPSLYRDLGRLVSADAPGGVAHGVVDVVPGTVVQRRDHPDHPDLPYVGPGAETV